MDEIVVHLDKERLVKSTLIQKYYASGICMIFEATTIDGVHLTIEASDVQTILENIPTRLKKRAW